MTKALKNALRGSTALGNLPVANLPALAKLELEDGTKFEDWLFAAASSPEGVSRRQIIRNAGGTPFATRPYLDRMARANGLRLVVEAGTADDGKPNNHPGQRFHARFYFVKPEDEAKLPVITGREAG